jgi:hypothetical protein
MNNDTMVARNPDVVARPLTDTEGGVLLHLETGAYHGLNTVGFLIWEELETERTVADLVAAVRAKVPDAPAQVADDVISFLEGALQRDLVRTADPRAERAR